MKTIEVKSCRECNLKKGVGVEYCSINGDIWQPMLPRDRVHENCPLKTESVTVKLKDDANNN